MTALLTRPAGPDSQPRRRRWLRVPLALTVVAGGAGMVWLIWFAPLTRARDVIVHGNNQVGTRQILDLAAVDTRVPLARLDPDRIAARIATSPVIKSVTVHRSWPSRVIITVTERQPVAYRTAGSAFEFLDSAAMAFRTVPTAPATLPLLTAADASLQAAGGSVAAALPATIRAATRAIAVPTAESITLTLDDGRTVVWGGLDRPGDKAALLPVLLKQPGGYFDISDPDVVISRAAA